MGDGNTVTVDGSQVQITQSGSYEMTQLVAEVRGMREQLIRMDERMNMVQDHETRLRNLEGFQLADHTGRLTSLEKWRYALPASFVLAVGAAIAAAINFASR